MAVICPNKFTCFCIIHCYCYYLFLFCFLCVLFLFVCFNFFVRGLFYVFIVCGFVFVCGCVWFLRHVFFFKVFMLN